MEEEKPKNGRPTKFKTEYIEQARKLALLGCTIEEIADFFEVHKDTVYEWMKTRKRFSDALNKGRRLANAEVASRLYDRAVGYEAEEKTFETYYDKKEGILKEKLTKRTTKHVEPNISAGIFFLKNREPEKWRDKHEVHKTGNGLEDIQIVIVE